MESPSPDQTEREILDIIQASFPVSHAPYAEIAGLLGAKLTDLQVLEKIRRLVEIGIIRRLGAVFDTRALGFASTLVGMKVPGGRIDEVAAIVSSYEGVSHNYQRDGEYNLWFTLAATNEKKLNETLDEIRSRTGCADCASLPVTRVHKILVHFDLGGRGQPPPSHVPQPSGRQPDLTDKDRRMVRELQGMISVDTLHPFQVLAERCGVFEEELLAAVSCWKQSGLIRRVGAVLRHQLVGMTFNAMSVWRVPDSELAIRTARELSRLKQVTHCYERRPAPGWPYNVYAMIHGESRQDCERLASEVARQTGVTDYALLYSTREYKKESLSYF